MCAGVLLNDPALYSAIESLTAAANLMVSDNVRRPPDAFESLTGIGEIVDLHLRGIAVARAALADAAKTAGESVAGVVCETDEADRTTAESLYTGFAVDGAPR
ncbi:MAG: hypothetical protein ACTHZ9_00095 [Leucobacter sp.]